MALAGVRTWFLYRQHLVVNPPRSANEDHNHGNRVLILDPSIGEPVGE